MDAFYRNRAARNKVNIAPWTLSGSKVAGLGEIHSRRSATRRVSVFSVQQRGGVAQERSPYLRQFFVVVQFLVKGFFKGGKGDKGGAYADGSDQ